MGAFAFLLELDTQQRFVTLASPPQPLLTPAMKVITPTSASATAMGLTGYDLVFGAHVDRANLQPSSRVVRGSIDVSQAHSASQWMLPPTGLSASGGNFSFTPPAGANLSFVDLVTGDRVRWTVFLFDGSTSFRLPPIAPDPLPGGTGAVMIASCLDLPGFDPGNFSVISARLALSQLSQAAFGFTR